MLQSIDLQTVEEYVTELQAAETLSVMSLSEETPSLEVQVAELLVGSRLSATQKETVRDAIGQNGFQNGGIALYSIVDPSELAYINLSVPYYKQETSNYCGPATTKQTLQYINGTSLSQDEYADQIGAWSNSLGRYYKRSEKYNGYASATTRIVPYVNANQSRHSYMVAGKEKYNVSVDDMKACINCGMENNYPIIFNIKVTGITPNTSASSLNAKWPYTTSGHFLNISGQYATGSAYYLTDPYYLYSSSSSTGKFQRSASVVHSAYNNMAF